MSTPAMSTPAMPDRGAPPTRVRTDRSSWNWLLIIPVVVPLLTFFFNRKSPTLLGFPFFYWCQLAFIVLGVGTTMLVYLRTKRGGDDAPTR
jgi:hypothetical protein